MENLPWLLHKEIHNPVLTNFKQIVQKLVQADERAGKVSFLRSRCSMVCCETGLHCLSAQLFQKQQSFITHSSNETFI